MPAGVRTAAYFYQPQYVGIDGERQFRALTLPIWATLNPQTGAISGTPNQSGLADVQIEVRNDTDTLQFTGTLKVESDALYLGSNLRDFYARDFNGNPRALRNDLDGDLAAEIQFVQSHSVAPNGNFQQNKADETNSRYMPKLTAQREALVLFLPQGNDVPDAVQAEVMVNGGLVETLTLNHPNTLPAADRSADQVVYSTKAWWAVIPWQHVRNGLSLHFSSTRGDTIRNGMLAATRIDIGEATQIVMKNLRLGMLTNVTRKNSHWVLVDPIMAATDYFQTLPVSKIIIGNYADVRLNSVIIASGTIYTTSSAVTGGWHEGDMRENVGKSQVSIGINLADFGQTSNNMSQSYNRRFKQITTHHAWGQYTNGRQEHGGSGGNGIGTLTDSWGNEASHEWGHDHGLGHYPGQDLTTDGRWARHHADSGWGYILHRKRMRSNLTGVTAEGAFKFGVDAMSGGATASALSKYTYYTGYSARNIQNHLAGFPIPDTGYASGYKKWNTTTGQYEEFVNSKNPNPVPKKVGVPVATLLGGYDPTGTAALIYPVFHGNYGNVFDLEAPDLDAAGDQCWVDVSNANNDVKQIKIAATRHNKGTINQLHFNLDASFRPTLAVLSCRRAGVITELTRTEFDGQIPELPPVAIVGQDAGFEQLKQREFGEIETWLQANAAPTIVSGDIASKIASYDRSELLDTLTADSRAKLEHILALQDATTSLQVLVQQAQHTGLDAQQTRERLRLHLQSNGLLENEIALQGSEISGNGYFFDARQGENQQVLLTLQSTVAAEQRSRWIQDQAGRFHLLDKPWLCLTQSGSQLYAKACQNDASHQRWTYHASYQNPWVLKNLSSGACIDYDHAKKLLITYGCTGNWNQRWNGITRNDENWLGVLAAAELKEISRLLLSGVE